MLEINFQGLSVLIEIFKEVLANPEWALGCLLFFGTVFVALASIIRFVLYALQIGEDRDRSKAGNVFWKTFAFACASYIVYVFLFQTFFPPDLGLFVEFIRSFPPPL
ncbi:MAG: hypothetical protein ACFFDI_11580 [Promethearchaeota archaeon]